MKIELVYVAPSQQIFETHELTEPCTIAEALERTQIASRLPAVELVDRHIGIFGKLKPLDTALRNNDRIEIYRDLIVDDPKQMRREKVEAVRKKRAKHVYRT